MSSDRPTAPPDPTEAAELAAFEQEARDEGEDKARLRRVCRYLRERPGVRVHVASGVIPGTLADLARR